MTDDKNELHVILGISGGVGQALARQLTNMNKKILGINRSGTYPQAIPQGIEIIAVDIFATDNLISLLKDREVTHIYNAVNVPYHKWVEIFPNIAETFVKIIQETDTIGVVADNLYMYGEDQTDNMNEQLPYRADGPKGKIRGEVAKIYDQAMEDGVMLTVCRAPDFFGSGVTEGSFYGSRVFETALQGKKVSLIGDLDKKHQIIYVDDFAKAMITIGENDEAIGQVWHAPSPPALTQREFVTMIFEELGKEPKLGSHPDLLIKFLALFNPLLREIKELLYEFNQDYLVDDNKYRQSFGNNVTNHKQAIAQTLQWYNQIV